MLIPWLVSRAACVIAVAQPLQVPQHSLLNASKSQSPHIFRADSIEALLHQHLEALPPQHYDTTTVRLLTQTAIAIYERSIDTAEQYAERAWRLAERLEDSTGLAAALNAAARIVRVHGEYQRSVGLGLRSAAISSALADTMALAEALNGIGNSYYWQGLYNVGLAYFFKALHLRERMNSTASQHQRAKAMLLTNIGKCYTRQAMYTEARTYHQRALALSRAASNEQAYIWLNIALLLVHQAQYDSALHYAQQALRFVQTHPNPLKAANEFEQVGDCFKHLGNLAAAEQHFAEARWRFAELRDMRGLARVDVGLGELAVRRRALETAFLRAQQALNVAESIGAKPQQYEALMLLVRLNELSADTSQALRIFRRAAAVKDSMVSEMSALSATAMNTLYETERQAQELALLIRGKQLQEQELTTQRSERLLLLIAAILLLLLVVVLANRYRLKVRSEVHIRQQHGLLEAQNEELKTLHQEKNELLGIAVHDLKNPLSAIMLNAQLIERIIGKNQPPERAVEYAMSINETAETMVAIVTNLLDINKIESGGWQMQFQAVEVSMVEALVETYRPRAQAKSIAIEYTMSIRNHDEQTPMFWADYDALRHVIDNLISNAVKYSPHGTTVFVSITDSANTDHTPLQHLLRIIVQDEGPGISEEDQQKLFKKFTRLSALPTGGEHSTGLGLSIVQRLVESLNGRVWCESTLGKGATFIVELPRFNTEHLQLLITEERGIINSVSSTTESLGQ